MSDYFGEYKLECYKKIKSLNSKDNLWIAADSVTGGRFVMRNLSVYSQEVYRILKTIRHSNILEIADVFLHDSRLYVIEEYLEWEPLSSALNDRRFSRRDAYGIGRQYLVLFCGWKMEKRWFLLSVF